MSSYYSISNSYYPDPFLWVGNSEAALMGGSGLKAFMALQSRGQMVCSYLEALLELKDLFQSGSLIWCWLLVGSLSFFPHGSLQAAWASLWHGRWFPSMWAIQEKAKQKPLSFWLRRGSQMTQTVISTISYWLHGLVLFTLGGEHTRMWLSENRVTGDHLEGWLQQLLYPLAANIELT